MDTPLPRSSVLDIRARRRYAQHAVTVIGVPGAQLPIQVAMAIERAHTAHCIVMYLPWEIVAMPDSTRRAAAPAKYPQVEAEMGRVEEQLKALRKTLSGGSTLRYSDVEKLGTAVSTLLGRAASACWD
jgi:hypothetical protein